MRFLANPRKEHRTLHIVLVFAMATVCFGVAYLTASAGVIIPLLSIGLIIASVYFFIVFNDPKIGFWMYAVYCFYVIFFIRHIDAIRFGNITDILLLMPWIAMLFNGKKYDWSKLNNDYVYLVGFWGLINILQLFNPYGASLMGWLHEVRFTLLNWLLIAPLAFILLDTRRDLNTFLKLIIILSVVSTIYGMKQLFLGVTAGEQVFLNGSRTHMIFGKLRVFSFYSDAGQFGASQAHIGLVALVLALGPFKWWKRICLFICAGILLYGMLISGTRGALFALVSGGVVALLLSKKFKIFVIGSVALFCFIAFLKYTTIGHNVYEIRRLRTALNPEDASLNVRFENQQKLRAILANMPFGGGVGVIGATGIQYNSDKVFSTIAPDSYWVKVWAMYGITGMTIWFAINMYIIGKCCGIAWRIRDDALRIKLIALTAGTVGVFVCSYGNEVINGYPSSLIVYLSWGMVLNSQRYIDEEPGEAAIDSQNARRPAIADPS